MVVIKCDSEPIRRWAVKIDRYLCAQLDGVIDNKDSWNKSIRWWNLTYLALLGSGIDSVDMSSLMRRSWGLA